jgi:16S rRNA (uracil1498-N3)-methyltransferase
MSVTAVVDGAWLAEPEGASVELRGDLFHHLCRVRRLGKGDALRLVDGQGRARAAEVVAIQRDHARLALGAALPAQDPARRLHLVVGALRPERASTLVEKATELGVARLSFLATERTPRHYGEGRLDRLQRVAVAALEQCQGARLPAIDGVHPWEAWPTLVDADERLVLAPSAEAGRLTASAASACVFIGPEGGFSPSELGELQAAGCRAVGLGARVLRVETAAIAAAALLLLG